MKKVLLILLLCLGLVLSGCVNRTTEDPTDDKPDVVDTDDDMDYDNDDDIVDHGDDIPEVNDGTNPVDPDIEYVIDDTPDPRNEEVDSKSDVNLALLEMIDAMQILVPESSNEDPYFSDEMPLVRSELDFMHTERSFDNPLNIGALNALAYLEDVQEDVAENELFEEDTWRTIEYVQMDNSWVTNVMYKVFVNEDDVYYQYYHEDGYDRIIGVDVTISNVNDVLEISFAMIGYYYDDYVWEHGLQTYYKEDEIEYTWQVFQHEGEYTGLNYFETNIVEDTFLHLTIDNSEEGVDRKRVKRYNPENDLYYNMLYKNDVQYYLFIEQYNNFNQSVYEVEFKNNDSLDFEFNLMLMDGWDSIDKVEYSNVLYNGDTEITLPYGVRVQLKDYYGIYIDGHKGADDSVDRFTLEGTTMTSPITYEALTTLKAEVQQETMTLANDFYTNEYETIQDHFDAIYELFNINVFYTLSQGYME